MEKTVKTTTFCRFYYRHYHINNQQNVTVDPFGEGWFEQAKEKIRNGQRYLKNCALLCLTVDIPK